MGRVKPKWPDSQRFHIKMPDGATMSYDLFDPHEEGEKGINFKNRGNLNIQTINKKYNIVDLWSCIQLVFNRMHIATYLLIISWELYCLFELSDIM